MAGTRPPPADATVIADSRAGVENEGKGGIRSRSPCRDDAVGGGAPGHGGEADRSEGAAAFAQTGRRDRL